MIIGLAISFLWLLQASNGVVLDRIAVIVGKHAIKASNIDRDLRVTAFLNRESVVFSPDAKKKAAERQIDQEIIRQEIATGGYPQAGEADAESLLDQIRRDRFGGSDAQLHSALTRYGLTEDQLKQQLQWQLTVLRFINDRFRPAVQITDDQVRGYYDQHLADLKRQYPGDSGFEALAPKIRELLIGEETNKQFETWLDGARKRARIEYREEALK